MIDFPECGRFTISVDQWVILEDIVGLIYELEDAGGPANGLNNGIVLITDLGVTVSIFRERETRVCE